MKRFLLWILGVALGTLLFIAGILGVSWYFTGVSAMPAQGAAQFAGQALTENGYLWQVPLIGAVADKVLYESPTLTVQKLETVTAAHPELTLPGWASAAEITITDETSGQVCFTGGAADYAAFAYPENATYDVVMRIWRLPAGMAETSLAQSSAWLARDPGLEQPSRAAGWYAYRFRFSLAASPTLTLSSDAVRQGGTVCVLLTGMVGEGTPAADTDLGTVSFEAVQGGGWKGYLGIAYNAEATVHTITVALGAQTVQAQLTVNGRSFGSVETPPDAEGDEAANQEYRNAIWPLYTAASGPAQWTGTWSAPVSYNAILVDYGVSRTSGGVAYGRSNDVTVSVDPGSAVLAPAGGTVVFAGTLALSGNTVVIDHGGGVRTYLFGLAGIGVQKGDAVKQGDTLGTTADKLSFDVKIGSKSVCPWDLFQGAGGLFWKAAAQ